MKKEHNKTEKGIVLLEAIIAISVLALIFTSTLQLFRGSIVGVRGATDTFVASELAQDVAEYAVAKRTENISRLGNTNWKDGLTCGTECSLNTLASSVANASMVACVGSTPCLLFVNNNKEYTYDGVTGSPAPVQSPYTRKITAVLSDGNKQLKITTAVSWNAGNHTETYTLTTFLYAP